MDYILKSGVLCTQNGPAARIRPGLPGPERDILSPDGAVALRAVVRTRPEQGRSSGDVRTRQYVLERPDGSAAACARPDYAPGQDPAAAGWPVSRLPRVDRARVTMGGEYLLVMENSRSYLLRDGSGAPVLHFRHRGLTGGWDVTCSASLAPETVCGLFLFCRCIERENEFLVV